MTTQTANPSPSTGLETDFRAFCTSVGCSPLFSDAAYRLFAMFTQQLDAASLPYWFASVCYLCSLSDSRCTLLNGNRVGLSELAQAGHLRLVDMFQSLKGLERLVSALDEEKLLVADFAPLAKERAQWEAHIRMLERKYVIASILFQKALKVYSMMSQSHDAEASVPAAATVLQDAGFQTVWLLFLVSKTRLLRDPPDLVNSFQLLLCSLGVVLSLLGDVSTGATPSDRLAGTLSDLCERLGADFAQVQELYTNHLAPLLQMLCNRGSLPETILHGVEEEDGVTTASPPPVDTLVEAV
eukprot:CAMPEP_0174231472 /NCGR_PEP_ID=MMETSP0417-20130205/1994_1 /TAXON_ID=242541 /ORGANISM="Mayorella sp, Strain BSH-02190019" /LENGTH=297 /DNA_ID=CAMNT_0015309367 /DNA_START=74 /DNA_END=963 /DNA_ORIENTATION=-